MVQRQDNLVSGRRTGLLALGLAALWTLAALPAIGMSRVPACPGPVIAADAWVDKMPSTSPRSGMLIVSLQFEDDQSWTLTPDAGAEGTELRLDLSPGGDVVPGTANFRERPREPARQSVVISCDGAPVAQIEEIKAAY